jgi:replication factor C large subunit
VRSAINDLQHLAQGRKELAHGDLGALSSRDRAENVFRTLQRMFRSRDFRSAAAAASNSDMDDRMLIAWIDENLFREFASGEELANAYAMLSRADIFNGRVERRQSWGLARYASELMSAGIALSRARQPYGWVGYRFPSNISYLSSAKPAREVRKSLAKKIGGLCHCASRTAVQDYLPLFSELFRDKEKAKALALALELDESEIEFLNPSVSGKQLLKEAEKTKKQGNPAQRTLLA